MLGKIIVTLWAFEESKGGRNQDEFSMGYIKFKVLVRQPDCSGAEYWFWS